MEQINPNPQSTEEALYQRFKVRMKNEALAEAADRAEQVVERQVVRAESWLKARHVWGAAGFIALLGAAGFALWALLGAGGLLAAGDHALGVGGKLAVETALAVVFSIAAVWVLALAVRDVPWIQRRVMPGADEMTDIEGLYWSLREGEADAADRSLLGSVVWALAIRNALTWVGVAIVFAAMLTVLAPLA